MHLSTQATTLGALLCKVCDFFCVQPVILLVRSVLVATLTALLPPKATEASVSHEERQRVAVLERQLTMFTCVWILPDMLLPHSARLKPLDPGTAAGAFAFKRTTRGAQGVSGDGLNVDCDSCK